MTTQAESLRQLDVSSTDAQAVSRAKVICYHCFEEVPTFCDLWAKVDGHNRPMCCIGCKAAAEFINERGLTRFYEHRAELNQRDFFDEVAKHSIESKQGGGRSEKWVFLDDEKEALDYISYASNGNRTFSLIIDGLYCSSCSWLIERALKGLSPSIVFQASIDARSVRISVSDRALALSELVSSIDLLGYSPTVQKIGDKSGFEQARKREASKALQRIVVAGFGMMQVMSYATAGYFGGSAEVTIADDIMSPDTERFFLLLSMLVSTVVVFYSGKPFFSNALNDLKNQHLGMDVPVALAIASAYFPSVYQVLTHNNSHVYFDSAVMFVFFLSLGRYIEMRARHRLTDGNASVADLLPQYIDVERNTADSALESLQITPQQVQLGDLYNLKQNTIVPFDALIIEGSGQFDESSINGEASYVGKQPGDRVVGGSLVSSGDFTVESTGDWKSSLIATIDHSLQAAMQSSQREKNQSLMIGRFFILGVLLLTLAVGCFWAVTAPESVFEICLAMMIASCPCAFSLAQPVGRSAAIHSLRGLGVLLTNNRALSLVSEISHWCFDKTGTLTQGIPKITLVHSKELVSETTCLQLLASLEKHSSHSLARALDIVKSPYRVTQFKEVTACGVEGTINAEHYLAGKRDWVTNRIGSDDDLLKRFPEIGTEIVIANSKEVLAIVQLNDSIRISASHFINRLLSDQIEVSVLSGDNAEAVNQIGQRLGIRSTYAALLPNDKVELLCRMKRGNRLVAMVGDGVNDAPVLAAADLSIAMASGSNLAINNADVVLLNGKFANLNELLTTSKRFLSITRQNLAWALGYNIVVLPLAATGNLTPWIAALGMSLSSLLVVLNALRIRTKTWK